MKGFSVCVFSAFLVFPIFAQEQVSVDAEAWKAIALKAEAQFKQGRFAEAAETGKQSLQVARRLGRRGSK